MAKTPPAAQTALGPMVIVAAEQYTPDAQRLVHDDLAARFLPAGLRLVARACAWPPVRRLLFKATERRAPGVYGLMLCRKRYGDDGVADAIAAGIPQIVLLGAGLDTRAYRLVAPAGAAAFEVDLPANIAYKEGRLRAIYGRVPERVALVAVDFETEDLSVALAAGGFRLGTPALFVWEGVTQYLTEDGVRKTLAFLSAAAPGSRLIFTYVLRDFVDGTDLHGAEQLYRQFVLGYRVWHFGLAPTSVSDLLQEYGWIEREQVGRAELVDRYLAPAGRELPVTEIERFVEAEKR